MDSPNRRTGGGLKAEIDTPCSYNQSKDDKKAPPKTAELKSILSNRSINSQVPSSSSGDTKNLNGSQTFVYIMEENNSMVGDSSTMSVARRGVDSLTMSVGGSRVNSRKTFVAGGGADSGTMFLAGKEVDSGATFADAGGVGSGIVFVGGGGPGTTFTDARRANSLVTFGGH